MVTRFVGMSVSFFDCLKKYSCAFVALVLAFALVPSVTPGKPSSDMSAVSARDNSSPPVFIRAKDNGSSPSVSAESAVVIECSSGGVVFSKNENERLPMASTTKIMTALTVIECCELTEKITVPKEACGIEGSSVYLREGEVFTVEEMLYALMLASANDAATALALHTSGSVAAFAEKMNEIACTLGLVDTHFTNPHGLNDDEHYTTAKELALIAAHASENEVFRRICSTKKTIIRRDSKESARLLTNHNRMLSRYEGCFGIKTGFTKASGRCLVSGAERDGLSFIAVTLNAPDDWNDHTVMLDYAFSRYERITLLREGELSLSLPLAGSLQSSVACTNSRAIYATVPEGLAGFEKTVELKRFEFAPVEKGELVGRIIFRYDGKIIAQSDIVTVFCAEKR